jgi:hypothetical protein
MTGTGRPALFGEQNNGKTAVGQQMHNSFSACSVPSLRDTVTRSAKPWLVRAVGHG